MTKRNQRELVIHNKAELLNALDRIDRLDLVEYVFKEPEIARIISEGKKLTSLKRDVAEVIDHFNLVVSPGKGGNSGR